MDFGEKVGLLGLFIVAALFVLWVSAVVSIIRSKQIVVVSQKIGWIVLNLFTLSIGSIIYFFRFKFLKRAWAGLALVAAFVTLMVAYVVVMSTPAGIVIEGSGPPIIPGQDAGPAVDTETASTKEISSGNYVKFTDPKYHFQIEYPKGTFVSLSEYPATKERAVKFSLIMDDPTVGPINGSFIVAERDISDLGISPSQYMQDVEDSATQFLLEGEKLLELKDIKIGDLPAKRTVMRLNMPTRFVKTYEVFTVKDNMYFGFTFSSDEKDYDRFIDIVQRMADSFSIE